MWILSWISFFADVSSEMVYPLLPLYLISVLGSSKTQLGAMEGSAVLIVALMSAYAGFRSDRKGPGRGRVPWIRLGYGLPVLGKTVIALASAWPMVLGGRLLDRFGKGLRGAPRDALIADAVSADQRGRAFGLHRAFDTAGALVGVLLSALLMWWLTGSPQKSATVESLGAAVETPAWVYRSIFAIGAVLGMASLILAFLIRESQSTDDANEETVKDSSDSEQLLAANAASNVSTPQKITDSPDRLAPAMWFGLPMEYWSVLAVFVLFSLANSSDTFILLRAHDLGYSPWAVVLVYAVFNVTYAAFSYPAGVLSDRLGRWRIIAVGWAIYACVYVGLALLPATQAWGLWPLMAIYGVYMALCEGVGKALIADRSPQESRGAAMGIFYAMTGLTTLAASLLTGTVWDQSGPTGALLISAGFAILALIALFLVRRKIA